MRKPIFIMLCLLFAFASDAQIVINELMASSDSLSNLPDEYGEYDDWIELYNGGTNAVNLGGYFLTDSSSNVMKWGIPDNTNIAADGYLIVWTDKDENNGQVPLHTNFRLNVAGEMVLLSDPEGNYVDSIAFGPQIANIAYARIPNGTGNFESRVPSFGFNNEDVSATNELDPGKVLVYPNPAYEMIQVELEKLDSENLKLEVVNQLGQVMLFMDLQEKVEMVDVSELVNGQYYIKITDGKNVLLRPFIKQ